MAEMGENASYRESHVRAFEIGKKYSAINSEDMPEMNLFGCFIGALF